MMSQLQKEVDRGNRAGWWFLVATWIVVVPLAIWLALLTIDERQQGAKLRGVDIAGPCRAYGIQNNECQKQARRIFAACYVQQEECWDKYGLPRRRIPDREVAAADRFDRHPAVWRRGAGAGLGTTSPGGGDANGGENPPGPGRGVGTDDPSAPTPTGSDPTPEPPSGGSDPEPEPATPEARQEPSRGPLPQPAAPAPNKPLPDQVTETAEEAVGGVVQEVDGVTGGGVCGTVAAQGCEKP
jgi:hypothetical protein